LKRRVFQVEGGLALRGLKDGGSSLAARLVRIWWTISIVRFWWLIIGKLREIILWSAQWSFACAVIGFTRC